MTNATHTPTPLTDAAQDFADCPLAVWDSLREIEAQHAALVAALRAATEVIALDTFCGSRDAKAFAKYEPRQGYGVDREQLVSDNRALLAQIDREQA